MPYLAPRRMKTCARPGSVTQVTMRRSVIGAEQGERVFWRVGGTATKALAVTVDRAHFKEG
jgi:hypothetical protein